MESFVVFWVFHQLSYLSRDWKQRLLFDMKSFMGQKIWAFIVCDLADELYMLMSWNVVPLELYHHIINVSLISHFRHDLLYLVQETDAAYYLCLSKMCFCGRLNFNLLWLMHFDALSLTFKTYWLIFISTWFQENSEAWLALVRFKCSVFCVFLLVCFVSNEGAPYLYFNPCWGVCCHPLSRGCIPLF